MADPISFTPSDASLAVPVAPGAVLGTVAVMPSGYKWAFGI